MDQPSAEHPPPNAWPAFTPRRPGRAPAACSPLYFLGVAAPWHAGNDPGVPGSFRPRRQVAPPRRFGYTLRLTSSPRLAHEGAEYARSPPGRAAHRAVCPQPRRPSGGRSRQATCPAKPRRSRKPPLRSQYNEAMVRTEYIDPFFIALGWDVHNTAGYGPQAPRRHHSVAPGEATAGRHWVFRRSAPSSRPRGHSSRLRPPRRTTPGRHSGAVALSSPKGSRLDRQIDQLVYELYGLTEEEIWIVEDATK